MEVMVANSTSSTSPWGGDGEGWLARSVRHVGEVAIHQARYASAKYTLREPV